MITVCCYTLLLFVSGLLLIDSERGLEFPSHDGKDRLINLSRKNFNRFLKKYDILMVYFTIPQNLQDHAQAKQWQLTQDMLELAAQITEREGVGFGVVDLDKDRKLAEKLGIFEAGAIYAYKSGHRVEFNGQRSTDVVVEFLLKLDEHPIEGIDSKVEVQSFKRDELCKLVGYFASTNSAAYEDFVDAALDFHPKISFYAVFQKLLAKQLGMTEINQIDFYEPYMKKPIPISGKSPHTNNAIEDFVWEHKRATMRKLRQLDMYDTWEDDVNGIHVVAFADDSDPEGYEFLQLLKEIAQAHTNDPNLSIVWIDPNDFTLLHDYWEQTFGIDLNTPQIGVVNVTDADSVWMERRKSRLPNHTELEKWIKDVMSGKINTEEDDDDFNLEEDDEDDSEEDEADEEETGDDKDIENSDEVDDEDDDEEEEAKEPISIIPKVKEPKRKKSRTEL